MKPNRNNQKTMFLNQILIKNTRSGTSQDFNFKPIDDFKQISHSYFNPRLNHRNSQQLLSPQIRKKISSSSGKIKNLTLDLKPIMNMNTNLQLNISSKPKPFSTFAPSKQIKSRVDQIKDLRTQKPEIKKNKKNKDNAAQLFRQNIQAYLVSNRITMNKQIDDLNQAKVMNIYAIKLPIITKSIQKNLELIDLIPNKIQINNERKQNITKKNIQDRYFNSKMLQVDDETNSREKMLQYRERKRQNYNEIKQICEKNNSQQQQQQPLKSSTKIQFNKDNNSKIKNNKRLSLIMRQKQITVYQHKIKTYRDFIFQINFAHNRFDPIILKDQFGLYKTQEKRFKAHIGKGNNSLLIKSLIKRRFWWSIQQDPNICNFVWTQLKMNDYFNLQVKMIKKQRYGSDISEVSEQKNWQKMIKIKKQRHPIVIKKNKFKVSLPTGLYKIFTKKDVQIYKKYQNNVKNNEKMDEYENRIKLIDKKLIPVEDKFKYRVHNHLENNFYLGNKKAMFYNLKQYYGLINKNVFEYLPLTFHIKKGLQDKQFKEFLKYHKKKQIQIENQKNFNNDNQSDNDQRRRRNIWIVKPGQNSNRGYGITVIDQISQLTAQIKKKQFHPNGTPKTYIIQEYIEYPLLYYKRKFDIRHYMLITTLYGKMRGYWYSEGYIRTSSYDFDIDDLGNQMIHLTNDAIQKNGQDYGKYEEGNKISYIQFQKYLNSTYPTKNYSFYETIYPKMKQVALDSIRASYLRLDPNKRQHNFEIFGLDFMIDQNFNVWLIQINTNPCLEISSALLGRIIPTMVQHSFRLSLDILFPPLAQYPNTMKHLAPDNALQTLKYQLIFDEENEQKQLSRLYKNNMELDCGDISQQQQTYENEGKECQQQQML